MAQRGFVLHQDKTLHESTITTNKMWRKTNTEETVHRAPEISTDVSMLTSSKNLQVFKKTKNNKKQQPSRGIPAALYSLALDCTKQYIKPGQCFLAGKYFRAVFVHWS